MVPLRTVVLVLLATTISLVSGEMDYMLIAPKQIRPGLEYTASLYYSDAIVAEIQVEVRILEKEVVLVTDTKTQSSGTLELYTLLIPDTIEDGNTYILEVIGKLGEEIVFQNSTELANFNLAISMKTSMLFIQTDKGIYQPGSTIKFRVMSLTPDLLPNPEIINVLVVDPAGNKVKRWDAVTLTADAPVFSGEYKLADRTMFGEWKIDVETQLEKKTVGVIVEEYVLPRFDVQISLSPNLMFDKGEIDGEIVSKYSYGKDVKGTVEIKLSVPWMEDTPITSLIKPIDGRTSFTIEFTEAQLAMYGCRADHRICTLTLTAEVTEELSGTSYLEETKVTLHSYREKITFIDAAPVLKPGLPYTGSISITEQDGSQLILEPGDDDQISVEIVYHIWTPCVYCYNYTYYNSSSTVDDEEAVLDIAATEEPINDTMTKSKPNPCASSSCTIIESCYNSTCHHSYNNFQNFTIPANGFVSFEFAAVESVTSATLSVHYKGRVAVYHYVNSRFASGNNQSLELDALTESPVVGSNMDFHLSASTTFTQAFVLVAANGRVVYNAIITDPDFIIPVTSDMAPMCTVIVYFIHDGEVIADIVKTRVSGVFRNQVSTTFSSTEQDVGTEITLTVNAEANSLVYVLAIDKTVLQLAEANDFTEEIVGDELDAFGMETGSKYPPCGGCLPVGALNRKKRDIMPGWYTPGNTDSVIRDAGLIYLTDINVYRQQDVWAERANNDMEDDAVADAMQPGVAKNDEGGDSGGAVAERKHFPETWLWISDETTGDDGQFTRNVVLPDTITTWIATAFALHSTAGLGIANTPAEVTGFKPFFVYPNLPVSLVRGEAFDLDISIFNYITSGGDSVEATVTIDNEPNWYTVMGKREETIDVPKDGAATVTFKVAPKKPGRMPIRISAVASDNIHTDIVLKYIHVFPEGQQKTDSAGFLMKVTPDNPPLETPYTIDFPELIVPDSKYVKVTVTGNVMGPTIDGLENLVQRPYGCGEQNIISLVPNIYVHDLMKSTGRLSMDLDRRTTEHMEEGVQRELTFQRGDGSFSAFAPRADDPSDNGSTWLTAFVMQSFTEAIPFVTIDLANLDKGMTFILDNQQAEGLFEEKGRVIHKNMQGGTADGLSKTMAAYMLITMLMTDAHVDIDMTNAISLTQALLETEVTPDTEDPYLLAITAYALQLAGSSYTDALVTKLDSLATNNAGGRYWEIPTTDDDALTQSYYSSGPSNVEMTSYVLKTYVLRDDFGNGASVMKWLAEQRNPNGGFHSTQDTVLALGAMAAYYKKTYTTDNLNVEVDVTIDGITQKLTVTEENADLVQAFEVENPAANDVTIVATGEGDIFVQISWAYNEEGTGDDATVNFVIEPADGKRRKRAAPGEVVEMKLCLQLNDFVEDMAVCEIGIPSGHIVTMGDLDTYVDNVEITTKIVFYFRQLPANYMSCSYFFFPKEINVENPQPANAMCYFYYESGSGTMKPYTLTGEDPGAVPLVYSLGDRSTTTPDPDSGENTQNPWYSGSSTQGTMRITILLPLLAMVVLIGGRF